MTLLPLLMIIIIIIIIMVSGRMRSHAVTYGQVRSDAVYVRLQVDESRERKAMVERTEKDMHFYQRQMKLARNLRREEYKRQMTAQKLQKENERAEELASQVTPPLASPRVSAALLPSSHVSFSHLLSS